MSNISWFFLFLGEPGGQDAGEELVPNPGHTVEAYSIRSQ